MVGKKGATSSIESSGAYRFDKPQHFQRKRNKPQIEASGVYRFDEPQHLKSKRNIGESEIQKEY